MKRTLIEEIRMLAGVWLFVLAPVVFLHSTRKYNLVELTCLSTSSSLKNVINAALSSCNVTFWDVFSKQVPLWSLVYINGTSVILTWLGSENDNKECFLSGGNWFQACILHTRGYTGAYQKLVFRNFFSETLIPPTPRSMGWTHVLWTRKTDHGGCNNDEIKMQLKILK